ncbi:MAG: sigma-70 family RNA polymerase sigma factor [Saccharofermentans sp.]|nr:sigma-70 family RNA polymerase sigma factor [Saccharofermentans sp.]
MSKYSQEDINKIINAIERFKGGDKDAFNEFYELTYDQVFRTCAGLMKNEHDAEDITQEVFIRSYEKLDSLAEPATFGQWLKVISTNTCLNELKKKERATLSFDESFSESDEDDWESFDQLPNTFIEEEEKSEIINKILKDSLSDVQYQALRLFYYEEMSMAEIAEQMDCPEGTVKTRLKSAKAKFKDSLEKYVDENKLVLSATPFLTRFFLAQETKLKVPPMPPFSFPGIGAGTAATAGTAGAATAAAAKAGFMSTVLGKVIVGVGAVAVIGTAVVVGVNLFADKHEEPVETTEESEIIETETTTEETTTEETTTEETTAAPIEIDPFEYIEVTFEGIAPDGEVIVNVSDDIPVEMNVVAEPSGALNNGDTVTITVSCDEEGYTLVNSSQEFTVSGLERVVEVYQADTITGTDWEGNPIELNVPAVSISGLDMTEVNAAMRGFIDDNNYCQSGVYSYYVCDDYVSIMITLEYHGDGDGYEKAAYNISTETGEILGKEEFLALIGMTNEEYESLVVTELNLFMDEYQDAHPGDEPDWKWFDSQVSYEDNTTTLRNYNTRPEVLSESVPYISESGDLCFVCRFTFIFEWSDYNAFAIDTVTHECFSQIEGGWCSYGNIGSY